MAGRVNGHMLHEPLGNAGHRVDLADPVNFIPEKLHPDGTPRPVSRVNFQGVPPETEFIPGEIQVVSLIADFRQLFQHLVQRVLLADPQGDHHAFIVDGVAQTVQAADGADHDHVPPLKERGGGTVAQPVNLLVHRGILLDIGIRVGDIGLRLVVIVVGNEIFHRVFREKLPELAAKLGSQGLIVRQHQSRPVHLLDDGGHGEGLAGAGNTKKGLLVKPPVHAVYQLFNGLRLIAGGLVFRYQFEMIHIFLLRAAGSAQRNSRTAPWKCNLPRPPQCGR